MARVMALRLAAGLVPSFSMRAICRALPSSVFITLPMTLVEVPNCCWCSSQDAASL